MERGREGEKREEKEEEEGYAVIRGRGNVGVGRSKRARRTISRIFAANEPPRIRRGSYVSRTVGGGEIAR